MGSRVPNVLSIAGSDPSGGAGIQADLRTFAALGVYGCAALTALTAQNTVAVSAVFPVPADFVRQQLEAVFSDIELSAVKIGMLGSLAAARVVADILRAYSPPFVVLDPVMRASTGAVLLADDALRALRDELMPLATIVTPNAFEAGVLAGTPAPRSVREAHDAAQRLVAHGARAVLVTGGHLDEPDVSVDVLHMDSDTFEYRVPRIAAIETHGTGCTLSSAIAAFLARGHALPDACERAQRFVSDAIARRDELHAGHGAAPVYQRGAAWAPGRHTPLSK